MADQNQSNESQCAGARSIRFGFWTLALFLLLGLLLEFLLGFKVESYVGVQSETRRMMWRLAHAHGTLTSVLHIVYGLTVYVLPADSSKSRKLVATCLRLGTVLLCGGFFLGGFGTVEGDPGIGIFLAPVGALALLLAIFVAARNLSSTPTTVVDDNADDDEWSA